MQPEIAETCRLRASIAKMKTKEMHSAEKKISAKLAKLCSVFYAYAYTNLSEDEIQQQYVITWSRLSLERIEIFPKQTTSYIKGLYTLHYVEIQAYTNKFMVIAKYWVSKVTHHRMRWKILKP